MVHNYDDRTVEISDIELQYDQNIFDIEVVVNNGLVYDKRYTSRQQFDLDNGVYSITTKNKKKLI